MKLAAFLRQVAAAAAAARERAADRALRNFRKQAGSDVLEPKTVKLRLPDGRLVKAPKMALTKPSTMLLREMEIEFETSVDVDDESKGKAADVFEGKLADMPSEDGSAIPMTGLTISLKRGLFRRQMGIRVRAKFAVDDAPEGVSVLQESMNAAIRTQLH